MTYEVGNLGPALGQAHKCGVVKPDYWDPNPPLLIIRYPMTIQI